MILGTGVDIVEVVRIEESMKKFGQRFLNRVFLPDEVAYAKSRKYPARHLAARFAAKEAVSKAFGTGMGEKLGWRDIEVRRKDSGEPFIVLRGKGLKLLKSRRASVPTITLSHTDHYAAAVAILEGRR